MQALRGPSKYDDEPSRHPSLKINAKQPFNAETPRTILVESYVTPVDMFYKRNHGPIPVLDDPQRYRVKVGGLVPKTLLISMDDIRMLPKYTVTAILQCAGNRRTPMSKTKPVKGVGWDVGALGNAVWGGAKLSDLLKLADIPENTANTEAGGKHVEFTSVDVCKEENGGPYKASIPLLHATNPKADVLLAYEMNGEVLNRDHGYPLRVVVPGIIGARSVKWLDRIDLIENECQVTEPLVRVLRMVDGEGMPMGFIYEAMNRAKEAISHYYRGNTRKCEILWRIIDRRWTNQLHQPIHAFAYFLNPKFYFSDSFRVDEEVMAGVITCIDKMTPDPELRDKVLDELEGFFMQKDYKMFPPTVDWHNINWLSRRPLMDFPIQCVICSLEDVCSMEWGKKVNIHGYALSGGGRGIERVDVSVDGGKTWIEASRYQKRGVPYVADSEECDKWSWVFFELQTEIYPPTDIIAKAVDSAANVQPEKVDTIWNLRGVLNNSWHVVHVNSTAKAMRSSL